MGKGITKVGEIMLRIACISNTFRDGKGFIEYKFRDKIEEIRHTTNIYKLKNGDIIENCYGEQDRYNFIIHPLYQTLFDVIKQRTARP